jgi:hypothetical protein
METTSCRVKPRTPPPRMDKTFLDRAWPLWQAGELIEAGRLLFESMPAEERAPWAIGFLKFAVARCGLSSAPVENLMSIVDDPARWGEAHGAFRLLRQTGLQIDRTQTLTDEQQILSRLLCVGEITAKVIYNASNSPRPFDHNVGWWVAQILKHFLDHVNGEDSSEQAWLLLCGQEESF